MYWIPPGDLGYAKYFAIRNSKYTWILQLDADFIYYDCASKYIWGFIEGLDKRRYYLVYWPLILLCDDLRHVYSEVYHIEHWLFTYSSSSRLT
jgi:hypothetical protein